MGGNQKAYSDFDAPVEWTQEDGCSSSILTLYLPGFSKERLRVQVSSSRKLRISGERPLPNNKWQRFHKEFQIPSTCDANNITANYKGGILYVRLPLLEPISEAKTGKQQHPHPPPENGKNNIRLSTAGGAGDQDRHLETENNIASAGDQGESKNNTAISSTEAAVAGGGGRGGWRLSLGNRYCLFFSILLLALLVFYALNFKFYPYLVHNPDLHAQS